MCIRDRPVYEKYRSTAYSGRTAIRARIAIARLPEMSTWAASAAHDRRTADATTPAPKTSTVSSGDTTVPVSRIRIAGTATAAVTPSGRHIDETARVALLVASATRRATRAACDHPS